MSNEPSALDIETAWRPSDGYREGVSEPMVSLPRLTLQRIVALAWRAEDRDGADLTALGIAAHAIRIATQSTNTAGEGG